MTSNTPDRRIQRTKKLLRDALITLLKDKSIDKVTPTELCRIADINRNTFYCHYKTPRDLLDEIEGELYSAISDCLGDCDNPSKKIVALCNLAREKHELAYIMFSDNLDYKFRENIFALIIESNFKKIDKETNKLAPLYRDMLAHYTSFGAASAIEVWVKNGMKEDPSKVVEFIINLIHHGTSSIT